MKYTAQLLCKDYFINHDIRIPITRVFFVAHVWCFFCSTHFILSRMRFFWGVVEKVFWGQSEGMSIHGWFGDDYSWWNAWKTMLPAQISGMKFGCATISTTSPKQLSFSQHVAFKFNVLPKHTQQQQKIINHKIITQQKQLYSCFFFQSSSTPQKRKQQQHQPSPIIKQTSN